jgi:hypothetical protein
MAVDIYFKSSEFPYYDETEIEISESNEMFIQALDMLFATPKTHVLGDPNFGIDLEQYIWSMTKSASSIKQEIINQINDHIDYTLLDLVNYDIEVNYLKGEVWDTVVIDVIIDGTKVAGYAAKP